MSGTIVDLSSQAAPSELTAEICIVGSGPGGATAAWELARAGRDVLVLEEGGDYPGPRLTQRDAEMYDQLYADRGGRSTIDLAISVLQGRVLGGGSVINACDVVPIPDEVARRWQKRDGLSDFAPEALAPFRDLALADLAASRPEERDLNRNNRLMLDGARALGLSTEIMLHNRVGCAGAGTCLLGCPIDAKRNARTVALPAAMSAGARVVVRARVTRIDDAGAEVKTLRVRALDAKGRREGRELRVRAKIVLLAANAIGSAALLLRSGIGNEHVGRHLMLQPQLPITALFADPVRFFRGIPQAIAVTALERVDDERGLSGSRIEPIGGTPGIVASMLPTLGHPGKALMSRFDHIAASLLLVPDAPNGSLRVDEAGRIRITYAMPDEQKQRYRDAARLAARAYFAAGATSVQIPTARPIVLDREADLAAIDALTFEPATAPFISAHQQGSVRFASSARDGAADPEGRVHGARDVLVVDSSGFPSSASSHTMTPIVTVSRMLARRLLARLGTR